MMKIFKKTGFFTLCLILIISMMFTACNKDDDKNTDASKTEAGKQSEDKKEELKPITGDDVAHAFGLIVAKAIKETKLDFNPDELLKGYNEGIADDFDTAKFMNAEMLLQRAFQEARVKMLAEKLEESNKFLEENKTKEGMKVTKSGLQYKILKAGDQKQKPKPGDIVKVRYIGKLIDGKVFDDNLKAEEPADIDLERVIPGWKEGLQLMTTGAKFQFFIPPNLAYGEQGVSQGGNVLIPSNAVITFEVELISIEVGGAKKENKGK